MLKINHDTNGTGGAAVLRLEGQVAGKWVQELRQAYGESRRVNRSLTFDLKDVTFIDAAGLAFFDEVWSDITVVNCSLFAAEQLKNVMVRQSKVR